jgi:hypothetical protein
MNLYSRNDTAARKVLAEVRKLAKSSKDDSQVQIEMYVNCREQGYALASCDDRKVAFSECRNSDQIVVYYGKRKDFTFNTNIPSDEVYENWQKRFNYNEAAKAARFIVKYLES